jgi:hypothetical protein
MKGSHRSFVEFQHAKETTEGELTAMFDSRAIQHVVKEAAGDNPHYVKKFLLHGEEKFFDELYEKVDESIRGLRGYQYNWPTALDTIIFSLLAREIGGVGIYDQKYLVCERTRAGWQHTPVIPAVHAAYRHWLRREIMHCIAREERVLLQFCCFRDTPAETRGRMFKHVVIQRIKSNGLEFQWKQATIKSFQDIASNSLDHDSLLLATCMQMFYTSQILQRFREWIFLSRVDRFWLAFKLMFGIIKVFRGCFGTGAIGLVGLLIQSLTLS